MVEPQIQQKLATKITHFTMQFRFKNIFFRTSTYLTLLKNILS